MRFQNRRDFAPGDTKAKLYRTSGKAAVTRENSWRNVRMSSR